MGEWTRQGMGADEWARQGKGHGKVDKAGDVGWMSGQGRG